VESAAANVELPKYHRYVLGTAAPKDVRKYWKPYKDIFFPGHFLPLAFWDALDKCPEVLGGCLGFAFFTKCTGLPNISAIHL